MDIITPEEHLSQPLKTNDKQFRFTVSFLAASDETFNVTSKKVYLSKSVEDDDFDVIKTPPGA